MQHRRPTPIIRKDPAAMPPIKTDNLASPPHFPVKNVAALQSESLQPSPA